VAAGSSSLGSAAISAQSFRAEFWAEIWRVVRLIRQISACKCLFNQTRAGLVPASHAGGHRFEFCRAHHLFSVIYACSILAKLERT